VSVGAYRGRFAPTPSGPLHFGSIVAATGSYADALAHGGEWHLRIDDLDPPRVAAGAEAAILACLDALGFQWTGPIVRQSERRDAYADALARLDAAGRIYPCTCSRAEIARAGLPGIEGPRYPGTCRAGPSHPDRAPALRVRVPEAPIVFEDALQGTVRQDLARATGDFVVRRADGVYAYHMACVVDDVHSGFDTIVRGADLLDSTPRQLWLYQLLNETPPAYLHLPVALDAGGQKLSKQTLADPVDRSRPSSAVASALSFLGHPPPVELAGAAPSQLWQWARQYWRRERIPKLAASPLPAGRVRA